MNNKTTIKKLTEKDIGKWVVYKPELENEKGKIYSFDNEKQVAYVVYKANNNWDLDHWKDYTAQATNYNDLFFIGEVNKNARKN